MDQDLAQHPKAKAQQLVFSLNKLGSVVESVVVSSSSERPSLTQYKEAIFRSGHLSLRGTMMNGNGFHHQPRHPSRDNLQQRRSGSASGATPRNSNNASGHARVRFPDDEGASGLHNPHSQNNNQLANFFSAIVGVFFGGIASICLLGLLTILGILYVGIKPFSVSMYRRLANQLAAASFLDAIALLLPNMRLYLTGDSDVPSPVGTSILVCNHLMDGDWWPILMLGRCVGLRGSVKAIMRNEILHLNMNTQQNNNSSGSGEHSSSRDTPRERRSASQSSPAMLKQATAAAVAVAAARSGATIGGGGGYGSPSAGAENILLSNSSGSSSGSPTSSNGSSSGAHTRHHTSRDLKILAKLLHAFMEFPLLNGEDYISDREHLFQLLRSFAENNGAEAPVHLLFFPEGWSLHNGADRRNVLAMSNEFAKREGRPQLRHLLLPKTTGFNASLECLRESSPVVYDVTMAYSGYDGSLPPKFDLSFQSLWTLMRHSFPTEIHIRIKRYSMEEVLQDASWLDKKWAEKDRLLSFFSTHQSFPTDGRGFCRHRVFNSRTHSIESSVIALSRLLAMPWTIPFLLFCSIPLFWTVLWIYLIHRGFKAIFPENADERLSSNDDAGSTGVAGQTPRSESATPFFPATPFASPSVATWRDMIANRDNDNPK
ncbi:Lysocardiolipin acyltransferase 1 [Seminavis robusta]|uniref:Lysocardiolipin acyltransferase 1 n=1 Tax=Seminavis robusta TaxID=568900 RepID=A0A9N8EQI5_9STRA|nr:Lysocardiolipin acyltransferase 1 [Seminavis robusta]|eukprot:Sro1514_g278900.1 Lysocardiolipin acyltransferase 1 (658) ;mRNA; f:16456-18555